jgi:hypothetical protein
MFQSSVTLSYQEFLKFILILLGYQARRGASHPLEALIRPAFIKLPVEDSKTKVVRVAAGKF